MLEHLLSRWKGKLFVLVLLGFVATDFIITITLSAADARLTSSKIHLRPELLKHQIGVTLVLVAAAGRSLPARLQGSDRHRGNPDVVTYLLLNVIVIGVGSLRACLHIHIIFRNGNS